MWLFFFLLFFYALLGAFILEKLGVKLIRTADNVLLWIYTLLFIFMSFNAGEYQNSFGHYFIYLVIYFCIFTALFILLVMLFDRMLESFKCFKEAIEKDNLRSVLIACIVALLIFTPLANIPSKHFAYKTCKFVDTFWHYEYPDYDDSDEY